MEQRLGDAIIENESEVSRGKKYSVSLLMVMSVIPFVGSTFQVAQTFQWNLRVSDGSFSKPEEYFSCFDESFKKYSIGNHRDSTNNNSCCHMDTESLVNLNLVYEYDRHETRDYQYFHIVFGLSGMIIVFGVILLISNTMQSNQRENSSQIASLTCYLFFGWIFHILNCILFFVSVTSLIPKNPLVSYFCGTSEFGDKSSFHRSSINTNKEAFLLHCLTQIGICPNYKAIYVYLYIMFGELLLYLPVSMGVRCLTANPEQGAQTASGHHEEK